MKLLNRPNVLISKNRMEDNAPSPLLRLYIGFLSGIYFLFLLFSVGCVGSSEQVRTHFYILESNQESVEIHPSGENYAVVLQDVVIPQYLNKPQIIVKSKEHELQLLETHQWGGNLQKNITRVLQKNLSVLLNTSRVYAVPHVPQAGVNKRVFVEIHRFEYDELKKQVVLDALWSIRNEAQSEPTEILKRETISQAVVESKPSVSKIVAAMSQCLFALSKNIAEGVKK